MPRHEQFEQLCALAAVGEISPDQHRDLLDHLKACDSCQRSYDEYRLLLHELPAATDNVQRFLEPAAAVQKALKERFLARARAENIQLSNSGGHRDVQLRLRQAKPFHVPIPVTVAASALLGALALFIAQKQWPSRAGSVAADPRDTQAVKTLAKIAPPPALIAQPVLDKASSNYLLVQLEKQNRELRERVIAIEEQLNATRAAKDRLEALVARLSVADAATNAEKQQNAELLAKAQAELEKAKADRTQLEAALVEQQARADMASEQLRLQTASIARERDLLSADRDIRDLMGARNLHIIDVHDADGRGKNKPIFGRVFFTEGKSLIFYAFDLDEKRLVNAKYSYQAWGERAGEPGSIKSLGIFYSDDRSLRRWVMKFDKPEELKQIDSVFVTLEPFDGAKKPLGQRLLYAYLSSHVNHP